MKTPPTPSFENERLQALEDTNLLYSPAEERFDRITRLASRHFDMPISLISIVAGNSQWFKSSQGLATSDTSREVSFCGNAILHTEALVISDTSTDPDFTDNPLVTANPKIRFYAGHPLFYKGMPLPIGNLLSGTSSSWVVDPGDQYLEESRRPSCNLSRLTTRLL